MLMMLIAALFLISAIKADTTEYYKEKNKRYKI